MHFADITVQAGQTSAVRLVELLKQTYKTKTFLYSNDYDKQGIIYWLGTNKGADKNYNNPVHNRLMCVELYGCRCHRDDDRTGPSDDGYYAQKPEQLFSVYEAYDFQVVSLSDDKFNEIEILLNFEQANISMSLTHYTIAYGIDGNGFCALRSWDLIGSMDKINWFTLSSHRNDTSLSNDNISQTFEIHEPRRCRYIRIDRKGYVSGGENVIDLQLWTAFSGIEFYGTVYFG
jgi:hypothetical protein